MNAPVSLLFGVHAHQPAGNFPEVVDEAHEKSYGPFLRTLHRHPRFRFAVHFSGWLLQELLERHPDDMALLQEMVARGQVELFGGGDMEPVLAAIPGRDRVAQLEALGDRLERALGTRPRGAWLTERVWEATVVPALLDAGIDYVTVDDYHFVCAGRDLSELGGHFSTEEDGRRLDLFPISEELRYRIPFAPAAETIRHLESLAREGQETAGIYFDDIEKFGIWPETHDWVYGRRWLEDFIEGVLGSSRLQTRHFGEFRARQPTRGVVYLPTTSYIEMGEWTLPAARADDFAELVSRHKEAGTYERFKPFLRGGIWRNFLSRYPEANWMHKRMLDLSARVAALGEKASGDMLPLLHRAQANDAYWHGLFGGLYLPHLRRAVWNAIVALEDALERCAPSEACTAMDLDLDGREEIFLRDDQWVAVVRDDVHAAVCELSHRALSHNFADTLTRRREHYHRLLDQTVARRAQHGGIASAHDRVAFRHEIVAADVVEDRRPRQSFMDTLFVEDGSQGFMPPYVRAGGTDATFLARSRAADIDKRFSLDRGILRVTYDIDAAEPLRWEVELNLAMPSCDGFLGRVRCGNLIVGGFGDVLHHGTTAALSLEDGVLQGGATLAMEPPATTTTQPLRTVSQSEAGFEKIMQACVVTLAWPLGVGRHRLTVEFGGTAVDAAPDA
jgi:hypothetical protein